MLVLVTDKHFAIDWIVICQIGNQPNNLSHGGQSLRCVLCCCELQHITFKIKRPDYDNSGFPFSGGFLLRRGNWLKNSRINSFVNIKLLFWFASLQYKQLPHVCFLYYCLLYDCSRVTSWEAFLAPFPTGYIGQGHHW